jgi:hypothetical protein
LRARVAPLPFVPIGLRQRRQQRDVEVHRDLVDLRRRRVEIGVRLGALRAVREAEDARPLDAEAADAVLLHDDLLARQERLLHDLARVRHRLQELAPEGNARRLRGAEQLHPELVPLGLGVQDDGERMRVSHLQIDDRIDDGGVEAHRDVGARAGVRQALYDLEPAEERDGVERRCSLARAAADALDHLALEDLPALLEAVLFAALADDLVEADELSRREDEAVELGRRGVDVLAAALLVAAAREVRLVLAEDGVHVEAGDERRRDARGHEDGGDRHGGRVGVARGDLEGGDGTVHVEVAPRLLGDGRVAVEVEAGGDRLGVLRLLEARELRKDARGVDRRQEGHVDPAGACALGGLGALQQVPRMADALRGQHDRGLVHGDAQLREGRLEQDALGLAPLRHQDELHLPGKERRDAGVHEARQLRRVGQGLPVHPDAGQHCPAGKVMGTRRVRPSRARGGKNAENGEADDERNLHDYPGNAPDQYRSSRALQVGDPAKPLVNRLPLGSTL